MALGLILPLSTPALNLKEAPVVYAALGARAIVPAEPALGSSIVETDLALADDRHL